MTVTFTYNGSIITGVTIDSELPTELVIPNKNGLIDITEIADGAFNGVFTTGTITLSFQATNTLTRIGTNAFRACSGFTGGLTIPNSVTTVGDNVFYLCSNFNGGLTLSTALQNIGGSMFQGCSKLTGDLTIPNSVTSIGGYAFSGCSGLDGNLTISQNMTSIGDNAFYGCSKLTGDLTIPNSVTSIGDNAFYGCAGLDGNLTISQNMTSIGNYAFSSCSGLTGDLTIPNSVTTIGYTAFSGCNFNPIILNKTQSMYTNSFSDNSEYVLDINQSDTIGIQFQNNVALQGGSSLPPGITLENNLLSGKPNPGVNGQFDFVLSGSQLNFTMNIEGEEQVCLLPDCDVLMGNGTYKNISEITVGDETVMGFFSRKPCRIVKLVKNTHDINTLEPTNVPYLIRKSAVSEGVPNKDIHVSGHHRMILKKENCNEFVGVQLFKLNTVTTPDITTQSTVNYFHIKLEDPMEGLIVNNLPLESLQE